MKDILPSIPWEYFGQYIQVSNNPGWEFEISVGNAKRGIVGYELDDKVCFENGSVHTAANIWKEQVDGGQLGYAVFDQTVIDGDGDISGVEIQIDNDDGECNPLDSLN